MIKSKKFGVSLVVPNFNGEKLLQKNLPGILEAKEYGPNGIIELVIVDDASSDESVPFIKKNYPSIRVIKHVKNRGFPAAVNTGVRASKGNLIALLNTDVTPQKDFLEKIIENFDDDRVFAVSLHERGFGYAKGTFTGGLINIGMGEETGAEHASFYVSGGSGVFRKSIWTLLGGMDEKLLSPFYWEDVDLSYRAAKRGYILLWSPFGNLTHEHESTMSKLPKEYVSRVKQRNQLLTTWKNITSAHLIRKHFVGLAKHTLKHPGYIKIILFALTRLTIALQRHKKEIKECKVSDEAVFARYA